MARVVISREDLFPVGTVVAAYRAAGPPPVSGRPPYGPAAGSETVDAGGLLTYASLMENAGYILHAPAPDRYLNIFVASSQSAGTDGADEVPDETADTFQPFRIILLSNGTVKAIPTGTPVPAMPTGVTAQVRVTSVRLSWTAAPTATEYVVYRNSAEVARAAAASYLDLAVTVGATYSYQAQTIDAYGQRSAVSAAVSAFIDPAGNVAPTVSVKAWPPAAPTNGKTILRVNARDADAQALALGLSVDSGSVVATDDPSVFIFTP